MLVVIQERLGVKPGSFLLIRKANMGKWDFFPGWGSEAEKRVRDRSPSPVFFFHEPL